jgi:hypothetical protein
MSNSKSDNVPEPWRKLTSLEEKLNGRVQLPLLRSKIRSLESERLLRYNSFQCIDAESVEELRSKYRIHLVEERTYSDSIDVEYFYELLRFNGSQYDSDAIGYSVITKIEKLSRETVGTGVTKMRQYEVNMICGYYLYPKR